jgi:DNA-binding response OmpR family regulator
MTDQKHTILIAEDDNPILNILTDALQDQGFEITQAKNGYDGLNLALQNHPDLILVDLLMPQMDGLTMVNKLRSDDWGKSAPIIMLTNISPDTDAALKAVMQYQPAYYMMKSNIKIDDLIAKIKEVLKISNS